MGPLTDEIADGSLIVIDSVAFIYFLEQNPRYHAAADELFGRLEAGALTAVASTLGVTEVLVDPLQQGDTARARATSLHGAAWLVSNDLKRRRVASEGLRPWLFEDHV